jgi:hypothetical protein
MQDATANLVDICAKGDNVQVNAIRDGVLLSKFASDKLIFAVSAVNVVILGHKIGSEFEDPRVQLVHTVMEIDKREL